MQCFFVYILEAHFVERDETGKFIDGWPRGHSFEYPQHRTQDDRMAMVEKFRQEFPQVACAAILMDVMPENKFNGAFGVWPDNVLVFNKHCEYMFKGQLDKHGRRDHPFTMEVRRLLKF